jgi:hypothetical protein
MLYESAKIDKTSYTVRIPGSHYISPVNNIGPVARQRPGKHILAAINTQTTINIALSMQWQMQTHSYNNRGIARVQCSLCVFCAWSVLSGALHFKAELVYTIDIHYR